MANTFPMGEECNSEMVTSGLLKGWLISCWISSLAPKLTHDHLICLLTSICHTSFSATDLFPWSLINQIQLGRRLLVHIERGRQFPLSPWAKGRRRQSASQNEKQRIRQETYPKDLPEAPCQSWAENSLISGCHSVIHPNAVFSVVSFITKPCPWENKTKRDNIMWNIRSLNFTFSKCYLWEFLDFHIAMGLLLPWRWVCQGETFHPFDSPQKG